MKTRPKGALTFGLLFAMGSAWCPTSWADWYTTSISFQPVPPQTVPTSNYPPGTTIVGREIILGSVPARVWFEMQVTGWPPEIMTHIQGTVSATDWEQDGGGYDGSSSMCMDMPSIGAGDLRPALQPCSTDSDCRGTMSGPFCPIQEVSKCVLWNGVSPSYFPAGKFCEPAFQNRCNSRWIAQGIPATVSIDFSTLDTRFGVDFVDNSDPDEHPTDFQPSYLGTLVLDVPADAKGTYTIDFNEFQTFMVIDGPPGTICGDMPCLQIFHPAKITVPCGRCCSGYASGQIECVDHVTANECAGYGAGAVFAANEVCPQGGGPACPACSLDEHCDDGVFCNGVEMCDSNGECGPGQSPCQSYEECEESTASCAPRIPAVSNWGLVVLVLALLIVAKLRRKAVEMGS